MLRIGKYTSVRSRVITSKQVNINSPLDPATNRIRSMPSGARKSNAECRLSVLYHIYLEAQTSEQSIIIMGQEIMWYGGAQFLLAGAEISSSERSLIFFGTEISLIVFTIVELLMPFTCPVAKYPIATPLSPLSTATCTYFPRRLSRTEGLSRIWKR